MVVSKVIGVAEVKRRFSETLTEISLKRERFIIQRRGKPVAAFVNLKDLEIIEKHGKSADMKGLLAALAAWEDFDDIDGFVQGIYNERLRATDRPINGVL